VIARRRNAASLGPPGALAAAVALQVLASGVALASPVPTLHPGGADQAPDSMTIDYPVRLAPPLLSLRSSAPLYLGNMDPAIPDSAASLVRRVPPAPRSAIAPAGPTGDAVTFSGTKSLSVEMGRGRSATLQQSLDLTLRGKIGGDVEVAAMLSDQNLPFEPDGTSREIDDLDRLSLSIRAPRGEATMGDFVLTGLPGQYGNLSRHLQGVRGTAQAGGARWNVAAAGAKGEKRSIQIYGEEGRQGPYPLVSRGLATGSAGVVAGSEVVWLDGVRLKRGADADYVIDYGVGSVTFTVRHPITAQSRIAVDFEAAAGDYRRSFYAATTQGAVRGSGTWYANYMKEGDDANSPVAGALTAQDRQTLSAMGDSAATTMPSGVRYAGPGAGSYAWDQSDPSHPHWVYLGTNRGDYDVTFASVGIGKGAYADTTAADGTDFYVYRGENLGSYAPGHPLAVPSSKMLLDLGGTAHLMSSVALDGEIARSGYDRNLLSTRDDGDNQGIAARFGARLDPRRVAIGGASLGTLRASALVRSQDARFEAFDRIDPTFEGERWNQREGSAGEARQEFAVQYDPRPGLSLSADLGRRTLPGDSRSVRNGAQAVLTGAVGGTAYWDVARNDAAGASGRRSRWGFDVARVRGRLLPRVALQDEWIQGQEGDSVDTRRSRDLAFGLQYAPTAGLRLRGGYGFRTDAVVAIAGETAALQSATTLEGGLSAHSGTSLSLDAGFTHRRVDGGSTLAGSDLAQLALLAGRPGAPVTSELRYDVTQLREPALVRRFVPVGAGSGTYDAFGNARWGGGYELVSSVGDPETHSRAIVQLRVDAYPGRAVVPSRAQPIWRGFGASSYLRVETLSTLALGDPSHLVDPGDYLAPGTTLQGTMAARQTFQFAPPGRRYDLTAELGFRREQNGQYEDLQSSRDAVDGRVAMRHPLPARMQLTGSVSADRAVQEVERVDTGQSIQDVTRGHGMELELSKQLSPAWSASLLGQGRRSVDLSHGGYLDFVSLGPTAHCAAGARFRLDGRVLWGRSAVYGLYQPPGLYVAAIPGNRVDYDFLGEYRLRERISLSLGLNGADTPQAPAFYTGRFELKGSF
jgi:hypothetical protein